MILILKIIAILHFRVDSDETQHAHVVWALTNGQLPYRDFFDNHMPLFQMACAPLLSLLGEHGFVIIELRFAMLAPFFVCLWCVFRLAEKLFPAGMAPWASLGAAAFPQFFYTSTEFRPDDLWAALWLTALVVALCGSFTFKRAFLFGIILGSAFGVSLKTVLLTASIGISVAIALGLQIGLGRKQTSWKSIPLYLLLIGGGAIIVPGCIVFYFASKGSLWIMYYCVIQHNIFPGLRTWQRFKYDQWIFPISAPFLIGLGILSYRQARDPRIGIRRAIVVLTPCIYVILLFSYWREITREDNLPYVPLLPLAAIPLFILLRRCFKGAPLEKLFFPVCLPVICAIEILCVWRMTPLRTNRVQGTTIGIRDVLLLSQPGDAVMDAKGDSVFRPRPIYWVYEPLTKARIRKGVIDDHLAASMIRTRTRLCYFSGDRWEPASAAFIGANYVHFDKDSFDLAVAGKELGSSSNDGTFSFDVIIPARYAIVSETGVTDGILDGKPYSTPVELDGGHHWFRRKSGGGWAAIFLADALAHGFHPLFDPSPRIP